jgi:hypothetical protein
MPQLRHFPFTFFFTIKQDLFIGLTQTIHFQQQTEVQELVHVITSNYITLLSSHCISVPRHRRNDILDTA